MDILDEITASIFRTDLTM